MVRLKWVDLHKFDFHCSLLSSNCSYDELDTMQACGLTAGMRGAFILMLKLFLFAFFGGKNCPIFWKTKPDLKGLGSVENANGISKVSY